MNKKNLNDLVIRQSEFKGEMGVGRADITPPPNIYARSWGSAKHDAAEGIHRPLVTTCLFLRGGDPQLELYLLCFDLGWGAGDSVLCLLSDCKNVILCRAAKINAENRDFSSAQGHSQSTSS